MTIQPWCTPFPILNQSVIPCLVLTVVLLLESSTKTYHVVLYSITLHKTQWLHRGSLFPPCSTIISRQEYKTLGLSSSSSGLEGKALPGRKRTFTKQQSAEKQSLTFGSLSSGPLINKIHTDTSNRIVMTGKLLFNLSEKYHELATQIQTVPGRWGYIQVSVSSGNDSIRALSVLIWALNIQY